MLRLQDKVASSYCTRQVNSSELSKGSVTKGIIQVELPHRGGSGSHWQERRIQCASNKDEETTVGLGWAYRRIHCGLSLSGICILVEGGRKLTTFKLEGIGNIARLCRTRTSKQVSICPLRTESGSQQKEVGLGKAAWKWTQKKGGIPGASSQGIPALSWLVIGKRTARCRAGGPGSTLAPEFKVL